VVTRALGRTARAWGVWLAALLAIALIAGQVPATWRVMTQNHAVDMAMAGRVVGSHLPAGAQVIYGGASRTGLWRQPFFGKRKFVPDDVRIVETTSLARGRSHVRSRGLVYLLVLDSSCMSSAVCDAPGVEWNDEITGYEPVAEFDRFTLYAPTAGQHGGSGALTALRALIDAFGPEWAFTEAAAAAHVLDARGRRDEARRLVTGACAAQTRLGPDDCRERLVEFYALGHLVR
jgi:hypothetical protein